MLPPKIFSLLLALCPIAVYATPTSSNSSISLSPLDNRTFIPWVDRRSLSDQAHLFRRADTDVGAGVGVGVELPQVGLSLGNITTKLGNINVENISIGNISVIVKIPLPGASPVSAFSAFVSDREIQSYPDTYLRESKTGATSIASSTASATSTVSSAAVTSPATTLTAQRWKEARRQVAIATTTDQTPSGTSASVSASATVSSNPIDIGAGNVFTEIGNITINVNTVNVSIGSVTIRNVSVGNIFIYVEVGQPDLSSLANTLGSTVSNVTSALPSA